MFDERFERMWRLYLRGCAAAFEAGTLEVHQLLVSHGKAAALPLTRADTYQNFDAHVTFNLACSGGGYQAPAHYHHTDL